MISPGQGQGAVAPSRRRPLFLLFAAGGRGRGRLGGGLGLLNGGFGRGLHGGYDLGRGRFGMHLVRGDLGHGGQARLRYAGSTLVVYDELGGTRRTVGVEITKRLLVGQTSTQMPQ